MINGLEDNNLRADFKWNWIISFLHAVISLYLGDLREVSRYMATTKQFSESYGLPLPPCTVCPIQLILIISPL